MDLTRHFSFPHVNLVRMTDGDIKETVALINPAYRYQDHVKGSSRTNPDHLRKRAGETQFFVAKADNKIIGCFYIEPKGQALHFGLLTVADDYRKSGLAPAMMATIEEAASANNFVTLDLDYMSLAPWLKEYYEKHGFKETGKITPWGTIDLIHMSKPLLAERTN